MTIALTKGDVAVLTRATGNSYRAGPLADTTSPFVFGVLLGSLIRGDACGTAIYAKLWASKLAVEADAGVVRTWHSGNIVELRDRETANPRLHCGRRCFMVMAVAAKHRAEKSVGSSCK